MRFIDYPLPHLRDLAEITVTVAAAAEVGIFESLSAGPKDPDDLARDLGLDRRAVEILLPALEDAGLLERDGGRFALLPRARSELGDPGTDRDRTRGLPLWLRNLHGWTQLPEVLRSGSPPLDGEVAEDPDSLSRYMAGMAATPAERIERVLDACLERVPEARRALDLGGGPGLYARSLVERGIPTTLLDRPETIGFVREEYGLAEVEGLQLVGSDFLSDPLPTGPFDLILASNVIHLYSPSENRRLFRELAEVSAPGGVLGVADFIRGESNRAPRFALVMLLRTPGGNTYSRDEVEGWLSEAGFGAPRLDAVDEDRHMITALREG